MVWRGWSRRRRVVVVVAVVLALLLVPVGAGGLALRIQYAGDPSPDAKTRGRDAVWLGHAWVDGRKTDGDLLALKTQLAGTGMRDLYVHTGPLEHDGSLRLPPRARWFVDAVHRAMPGLRVQAWLGDVVAPVEKPGLDLEDPAARDRIVRSSTQVLNLGFDGVHFDLEPVLSGSDGFLTLLDQVRALTSDRRVPARPGNRLPGDESTLAPVLSIAAPQLDPLPELHRLGKYWSRDYFAAAARRVDQIAVMSYDTAMALESVYGGYVARQTSLALEVTPPEVDLLMGLPAYQESNPSHWGHAETVAAAVRGARLALGRDAPTRQSFGLALYVDFTATPADWTAYRTGWGTRS